MLRIVKHLNSHLKSATQIVAKPQGKTTLGHWRRDAAFEGTP